MCLWTKSPLPGPEFDGYCYKVIKESSVGVWVGGITAGANQVQLKGSRWTTDPKDNSGLLGYCLENGVSYPFGFHCFLNLKDAQDVRECVQAWDRREKLEGNYLIIKVRVRNIVAAGTQGWSRGWLFGIEELGGMPSIVAREIRFVKMVS